MPLFDVPKRVGKEQDKVIAKKSVSITKAPTTVKRSGLLSQIEQIKKTVEKYLSKYKNDYKIITDINELSDYIDIANSVDYISIDTETTGLDPMQDKIVGLCLYVPNQKAVYVPINHTSYITGDRVGGQLTESEVSAVVQKLQQNNHIIMFNAKFDIRVIKNQLGIKLTCWWDCYLASRLMNENEPHKGLKALHQKYVLNGAEDEFSFDALFKGVSADKIPIDVFYLYASHDPLVTYELYEFQKQWVRLDHPRQDMRDIAWVFHNIEMPCVSVVADMEDNGIELDMQYAHELSERYTTRLNERITHFYELLDKYTDKIESFIRTHENAKLDMPINIASPSQIAVLLYDIFNVSSVDNKSPRGTGEAILRKIADTNDGDVKDICNAILDYREVAKLINTYIDKLPNCVNPKDGRIHCSFNQYGADTGRFSSSDPNLQNIPSHNKDIRKMFKATDDKSYVDEQNNSFTVDRWCEVNTADGWKYATAVVIGDVLIVEENNVTAQIIVRNIDISVDNNHIIYYC